MHNPPLKVLTFEESAEGPVEVIREGDRSAVGEEKALVARIVQQSQQELEGGEAAAFRVIEIAYLTVARGVQRHDADPEIERPAEEERVPHVLAPGGCDRTLVSGVTEENHANLLHLAVERVVAWVRRIDPHRVGKPLHVLAAASRPPLEFDDSIRPSGVNRNHGHENIGMPRTHVGDEPVRHVDRCLFGHGSPVGAMVVIQRVEQHAEASGYASDESYETLHVALYEIPFISPRGAQIDHRACPADRVPPGEPAGVHLDTRHVDGVVDPTRGVEIS